ncbi:MAG: magnesium transporter [Calditrichia bacterium]|jgi:magnesium transporter|nr:magnesium transporter [Calditrichia bacterium]
MKFISENDFAEILSSIRELIEKKNQGALLNLLIDLHPADIADLLTDLKKDERKYLFPLLPAEKASAVLTELDPPIVDQILEDVSEQRLSTLVDKMDSDDAADIISELPDEVAQSVLEQIPDEISEDVKELLLYEEDTAGGIMALEFVSVKNKSTVNQTIKAIRRVRKKMKTVHTIWVTNDDEKLLGSVSLTDLVLAKGKTLISKIINKDIKYVYTDMDQEEVAIFFRKYDLVTLPVVNSSHQLVGQITIDDIIDVVEEEASEDISLFAGASDEELQEDSFLKISWVRLPWLMVAFVGQLIAAFIIQQFEGTLVQIIALTFFMPVIMAMGGNSGIQSSIIVIRGLATGEISVESTWRRFFREFRVSLFIGLIFGVIMLLVVGLWLGNYMMGLIIGFALNLVILQATLFGGLIPFLLKRADIDPALASGPFITTFNDILGLLIYLVLITASIPYYL